MRLATLWAGSADPCETRESIRETDGVAHGLRAVLSAWHQVHNDKPVTVNQVIKALERLGEQRKDDPLHEALAEVARGTRGHQHAPVP